MKSLNELVSHFENLELDFLWRQHIPAGFPIILSGREGVGKTSIAIQIVKEVLDAHPGVVLWLPVEGSVRDTVIKAETLGIPRDRFLVPDHGLFDFNFDFSREGDLDELRKNIAEISKESKVLIVVVDSLSAMTPYEIKSDLIGKVMQKLNSLVCDEYKAALIYLHHQNKSSDKQGLDKSLGSVMITAAARIVFGIEKKNSVMRQIKCIKDNIGIDFPELLVLKTAKNFTIKEPEQSSDETMMERAEAFLLEIFTEKESYGATECSALAEKRGISPDTLNKARNILGVVSKKEGKIWIWRRPSILDPSCPSSSNPL